MRLPSYNRIRWNGLIVVDFEQVSGGVIWSVLRVFIKLTDISVFIDSMVESPALAEVAIFG
ncbi:hypothetical protein GZ78_18460 [Endozoicomonas numazuensis]|uniref:Uncharacterized protein n=1 Tax=Endozoicomonas numazuensis TaxID=1137799 RepID=A0A081NE14_9GAMM|nr:hypothetical protein GZ78_18460 [Endozoicomonas numazuensis]